MRDGAPAVLSETGAFRLALGLALAAVVAYAVARLTEPAAGLALGLGVCGVAPLAALAIGWWRHGRRTAGASAALLAVSYILVNVGAIVAITVVFDRHLSRIAWAGFGVVAVVVAVLVAGVLEAALRDDDGRHRQAFRERAVSGDPRHRVVLVADAPLEPQAVRHLGEAVGSGGGEIVVVAPALNSPIRHWMSDEDRARARAERLLAGALAELEAVGVDARGQVGSDDPLEAIDDVLRIFPADEIVLVTSPPGRRNWQERGLLERARADYGLPISRLTDRVSRGLSR